MARSGLGGVLLAPRSFLKGFRLSRLGFRQGPTQGDALQLGGVFIITPGQRVSWAYRSTGPDDFPRVEDIISAASSAALRSR